ncbi:MAG: bifunctional diaminohydroxyphosphoribosylaminopyrimidine deaminase/5-amino-6-(5-phosphoribosylamino)uracil reductase RibD [Candidatus Peribacteraceae bacterium]|nr:bifunctional diaminohydroxyphosphoribosylaminopyrimidine deaminase/5-amino-6-(5-phosphoribosylamino)uracil reductase RibD [Candidatus Peribacteraceae bacterium]MDD5742077.1 bifunctional diaminohydroxyphosphoribosylaminopyrimidine deaminase/5-amino-6-(5-phosphoribosylamino)uracil reductase RibD [Candidatus Peribacteraceae bacterium]
MHEPFIHRCLTLAEHGRGKVGTNPLVGAVLVRDGAIIAEAFHEEFGKPHAERALLEDFKDVIRPSDTLVVNLEPCCHQGKTPACTDIIRERGVKHVVFGMVDPDLRVAGKGIACLLKAGIRVTGPVERARCEWLNRGFISLRTKGRPWVTMRSARTKSGAIAKPDGSPLQITSEEQNSWTHQWLRARHDAILVGVQTVITDDPQLTNRFGLQLPSPLRIILDPHLRIPLTARVVGEPLAAGTMVVVAPGSDPAKRQELLERGVRIAEVPLSAVFFDLPILWSALTTPVRDFHGIASVLIEGGAKTWQSFRDAGAVDEEVVLMGAGEGISLS